MTGERIEAAKKYLQMLSMKTWVEYMSKHPDSSRENILNGLYSETQWSHQRIQKTFTKAHKDGVIFKVDDSDEFCMPIYRLTRGD